MAIADCIEVMEPFWYKRPEHVAALLAFEQTHSVALPNDFKQFLSWSNGGEGQFPNIYLSLWSIEHIAQLTKDYKIDHYLGPKVIPFGSDGGPICFLFDYRNGTSPGVVSVNFGDLDINELKSIANSFTEFLELAIAGTLVDDDL